MADPTSAAAGGTGIVDRLGDLVGSMRSGVGFGATAPAGSEQRIATGRTIGEQIGNAFGLATGEDSPLGRFESIVRWSAIAVVALVIAFAVGVLAYYLLPIRTWVGARME